MCARHRRGLYATKVTSGFRKGSYMLLRNVRRWLSKRMMPIERPNLRLAIVALAEMIGKNHTGPRVFGREFGLCRLKLKDMHPYLSEWLVREATAFLRMMGFIERITAVSPYREITGGRFGRWSRATATKTDSGVQFRSPPVQWKLTAALADLFMPNAPLQRSGDPLPPQRKKPLSKGFSKEGSEPVVDHCGGEPQPWRFSEAERIAALARVAEMDRMVFEGRGKLDGSKLGSWQADATKPRQRW